MPLWLPMFKYLNSVIESTIVWNWARVFKVGVSLGLTMLRSHSWVRLSKFGWFTIWSEDNSKVVVMPCGRQKYIIVFFQVVTILKNTSYETRVSDRLRYVMFGHWLANAWMLLFRTRSVAKFILLMISLR